MRILAQLTSRQLAFEYESQSPQRQRQNFPPNLNRFFLPAEETHLVSRNRSHSLEARMSQTGEMARWREESMSEIACPRRQSEANWPATNVSTPSAFATRLVSMLATLTKYESERTHLSWSARAAFREQNEGACAVPERLSLVRTCCSRSP